MFDDFEIPPIFDKEIFDFVSGFAFHRHFGVLFGINNQRFETPKDSLFLSFFGGAQRARDCRNLKAQTTVPLHIRIRQSSKAKVPFNKETSCFAAS